MNIEVESSDVIKLILQYLKEQNLMKSLQILQEESNVNLNMVDNMDRLMDAIHNGRWHHVLDIVAYLRLPHDIMQDLFEQIIIELYYYKEYETCHQLLHYSPPMIHLKQLQPHRWLYLNQIITAHINNNNNTNTNINTNDHITRELEQLMRMKDQKRYDLSDRIRREIIQAPPSRLMSLLTQALKYQQLTGVISKSGHYDLLRSDNNKIDLLLSSESMDSNNAIDASNKMDNTIDKQDMFFKRNTAAIKCGENQQVCSAAFSPDGQCLVTGSSDGFIEIWDFDTGYLRKDIEAQADGTLMLHNKDEPVHALSFSRDSELLATAGESGCIKIWKFYAGKAVLKFPTAHTRSITSIEFNEDGTQILSTSLDHCIKIHGLRSKQMLKDFRGHTSFVNNARYSRDYMRVISTSSDGSVRIWDVKTTDCIKVIDNLTPLLVSSTALANYDESGISLQQINENDQGMMESNETETTSTNSISSLLSTTHGRLPVRKFVFHPDAKKEEMYVINDSLVIYVLNSKNGKLLRTLYSKKLIAKYAPTSNTSTSTSTSLSSSSGDNKRIAFIDICISCRGNYLYVLAEDKVLYCFNTLAGKLVHVLKIHEQDVLGIAHHSHRNILASYSADKTLKVWRP